MTNHTESTPDPAEMFDVLANERRITLILVLVLIGQSTLSVRYLAEIVAVIETESQPRQLDTDDYRLTQQSLVKGHLETLEAAGVIQHDGNTVERGPQFAQYSRLALAYFELPAPGTTSLD